MLQENNHFWNQISGGGNWYSGGPVHSGHLNPPNWCVTFELIFYETLKEAYIKLSSGNIELKCAKNSLFSEKSLRGDTKDTLLEDLSFPASVINFKTGTYASRYFHGEMGSFSLVADYQ